MTKFKAMYWDGVIIFSICATIVIIIAYFILSISLRAPKNEINISANSVVHDTIKTTIHDTIWKDTLIIRKTITIKDTTR